MSLNKQKCDPVLGLKVHEHLVSLGLETPAIENALSVKERIFKIEGHFHAIMTALGLDLTDDSLIETPKRVAKMYVSEIFYGLDYETFPKCTAILNKFDADEMIVERNINVMTNCEHHFVVIDGLATVGYIPGQKVIGLSKINRIVEYFSKRPQVQERLTSQIADMMMDKLQPLGVGVVIEAEHFCVSSRGIKHHGCKTVTSKLLGNFLDADVKEEFLALTRR